MEGVPMSARLLVSMGAGLLALACSAAREPARVAVADPATRRDPPAGALVGGAGLHGGHAWLGVPFAQPPVGALRWRAPQPLPRWEGVREALAAGAPRSEEHTSELQSL